MINSISCKLHRFNPPPVTYYIILSFAILCAVVLRFVFYLGPSGADDMIYFAAVDDLLKGRDVSAVFTGYSHWGARLGMIGPIWASMNIMGMSELTSSLYPMIMSLCTILLIFYICVRHFSPTAAVIASYFYILLPQDIHLSGLMYPDVPVVFFGLLFMYLTGEITVNGSCTPMRSLAAGAVLGLGYYVRETSILLFLVLPLLVTVATDRKSYLKNCLFILMGFGFSVVLEGIIFWTLTDDPLNRFHLLLHKTKVLEPREFMSSGPQHGQGHDALKKYLLDPWKVLFGTYWVSPLMIVFAAGLIMNVLSYLRDIRINFISNRHFIVWLIMAAAVLIYFIYGPVYGFTVPLKREARYYHVVMPAIAILAAVFFHEMMDKRGISYYVAWSLICIYPIISFICIGSIKNRNADGIRLVENFIKANDADKYVLPDNWAAILKLREGKDYREDKIATYKYVRRARINEEMINNIITDLSNSGGIKYVFVVPRLHKIQVGFWRHLKWPLERMRLENKLSSGTTITCRLSRKLGIVGYLVPDSIMSRICYKTEIYIYRILDRVRR